MLKDTCANGVEVVVMVVWEEKGRAVVVGEICEVVEVSVAMECEINSESKRHFDNW